MQRSRFLRPMCALLVSATLALPTLAAGSAPEPGGGSSKGSGAAFSSGTDHGSAGSQLKHIRTVHTTYEVWVPFFGWTVVCESTRVECGPGGNNCPLSGPES